MCCGSMGCFEGGRQHCPYPCGRDSFRSFQCSPHTAKEFVLLLLSANGGDIYKKVPADAAMQKDRLILPALEYKLNSVCNAEMFRCTGACLQSLMGYAQKSITKSV